MGRESEQTFFQRHTDSQQAHEKMFSITIIREMQTKTTMRYPLRPLKKGCDQKDKKQILERI